VKIAINARFLLPGKLEGFGWYTHELVRRMVTNHPDDEFILFFDRPYDSTFVYGPNVRPVVLFPPSRHPFLWYWWFEYAVPKALRATGAQVFFCPDSYMSLSSSVPTVMTVHDIIPLHIPQQLPFWTRHYYRYFLPRFLRHATQVVTVSDYVRRDILNTVSGMEYRQISVIGNGCRSGFVPLSPAQQQEVREAFSEGQPYFFYTGAIHPRKNIPRLIRAFNLFKARSHSPAKLILAGRFAWNTGEVSTALQQSPYRNDIILPGYVPETQLVRLMASSHALIYVSLSEGFGLPPLEAMYCDVPVIAANTTSLPEVCGEAALLTDPYSETAIAQSMEMLWNRPEIGRQLVEKGRQQRQQFNWDNAADALYVLIQQTSKKK
jgi:glycosyltransferase involved in cell wall biosynthesis